MDDADTRTIDDIELQSEADRHSEPPLTLKQKWRKFRLIVRIIYISITVLAALFVVAMQILAMVVGTPSKPGIPALVVFYAMSSCEILLCIFVVFLELDFWKWLMSYFKFATFYSARALLQIYVGIAAYSNSVIFPNDSFDMAQEACAYVMVAVGLLHLLFGLLCLDRVFGLRSSK